MIVKKSTHANELDVDDNGKLHAIIQRRKTGFRIVIARGNHVHHDEVSQTWADCLRTNFPGAEIEPEAKEMIG